MGGLLDKFILLFVLVISIALHEFGHALMATKLGDPTPRLQGRLTPNPVAHFDPVGFLFLLLMVFVGFFFAWGKPVQTNPLYYKNDREGIILTALAGPAMNLCIAMFSVAFGFLLFSGSAELSYTGHTLLRYLVVVNIVLIAFNLLPVPPLDGGHLLQQLAPRFMEPLVRTVQTFGMLIVLALLWTGVAGIIIGTVLRIVANGLALAFGDNFASYLFGA